MKRKQVSTSSMRLITDKSYAPPRRASRLRDDDGKERKRETRIKRGPDASNNLDKPSVSYAARAWPGVA